MTRLRHAVAVVLACATDPAFACDLATEGQAAVYDNNTFQAVNIYDQMEFEPECKETREWIGVYLARAYQDASAQTSLPMDKRQDALQKSFAYQKHWRTVAISGQLYWEVKDFDKAARSLDVALGLVADGDPEHDISEDEFRMLHQLYTQSLSLALHPVEGENTYRTSFRNFVVEEVPSQITFEFNSTEFDQKGLVYATKLLEHLLIHRPNRIELDGHTDPQGSEAYNMDLSIARATAVRDFLTRRGYNGEIVVRGFGESQLPIPPAGHEAGSEEHYQIARRVTFKQG